MGGGPSGGRGSAALDDPLELRFEGTEEAAAALSIALIEAGLAIYALAPHSASLEELFFRLTEDTPAPLPAEQSS